MPKEVLEACPHPLIPALRPGKGDSKSQDIGDWATSLLAFHRSPTAVSEWEVVRIEWFKNQDGLEHEYSVFTVRRGAPPAELYLRFDRWSTPEALQANQAEGLVGAKAFATLSKEQQKEVIKIVNEETASLFDKRMRGIIHASKVSSGKGAGLEPEDTIKNSWNSNGIDKGDSGEVELMVTYSNFRHPFPLRDLAIIAQTVVAKSEAYLLLVQQCYWLTRTMVGISVTKYQPQPERGARQDAFSRAGKLSCLPFLPAITSDNPAEIATFLVDVNKSIEDDDTRVHAEYMNGEGGKLAAEEGKLAAERGKLAAERGKLAAERGKLAAEQSLATERQRRIEAENRARVMEEQLAAYARSSDGIPSASNAEVH